MKQCPVCMSLDIMLSSGGIDGKYQCKNCNYVGVIVIEKKEKHFFLL